MHTRTMPPAAKAMLLYLVLPAVNLYLLVLIFAADRAEPAGASYRYAKWTASNGVELHTMHTTPGHVTLEAIAANVTETTNEGINGGFFYENSLLSIAIVGDRPVFGKRGDYGSGFFNVKYKRGTLVWDASARRFSVQRVESADDLIVADRAHYWAQGGVSMSLQDEANWRNTLEQEAMPLPDDDHMRSALVYDNEQTLWLVVTPTPCTIEQFRGAVKQKIAPGRLFDGIFLDGDGSSQMRNARISLPGDSREVRQMIKVTG